MIQEHKRPLKKHKNRQKGERKCLGLLLLSEQELVSESEKHKIHMPTHSFAVVNYYVLFVLYKLCVCVCVCEISQLCCRKLWCVK